MNFSFTPYFDQSQETEFLYFQGYQLTAFTSYTLAITGSNEGKPESYTQNPLQDLLEMTKHLHLYHQNWLKDSKSNIKQLETLLCDQILNRFQHEIPPFLLINTKTNGSVHILKKTCSYRVWLLREQRLYCLDCSSLWTKWKLGYHQWIPNETETVFTSYSWRSKAKDVLFLQKEQRSLPKKKKNKQKLKTKLLASDQSKLKMLDFFGQINLE